MSDLPTIDFPTIQVSAGLPGASPETMASTVALPLEKQFAGIAGLSNINSVSQQGNTSITLQFDLSRNIDAAAQDVQAMIGRASRALPPQMPAPPSYQKSNPGDQSVILLVLRSATLPLSMIDEYAQQSIAQRLSMVAGVAQIDVFGSQKYAVRIDVDPRELAARAIGIDEVANAIGSANSNLPRVRSSAQKTFVVQTNAQLMRASGFAPSIIAYRNGNPVRLEEVARVYDGVENDRSGAWQRGDRCVMISIRKIPGANVVEVVDRIKALLPSIREQLPAAMALDTRNDRSATIRESVHDVKLTLLITVVLVVLVIFLFLRNVSATLIPSLALPASLVGTFMVMYLLGYSLDNMSLMALTLSVGFVVDDAIVMLENIVRHMEMGKPPMQAAYDGSKEIAFTIRLDDVVARRRLHPGAVHGRHRRPAAARVRGHDWRRHPDFRVRLAQSHADAVQPLPEAAARDPARLDVQRHRSRLPGLAAVLRLDAPRRASLQTRHGRGVGRAARRHHLPLHDRADRLPAERGSGPVDGEHGSGAGHQLRGHDAPPDARWPNCSSRTRTWPAPTSWSARSATTPAR